MKAILITFFLTFAFVICAPAQSLKITTKKVTYTRKGADVPEYKRTFDVSYPIIKTKLSASVRRTFTTNLSYWKAFSSKDFTWRLRDSINGDYWISELSYAVKYNANNILAIWLTMEGSAAYPDHSIKYVVVDIRTGKRLAIPDLFERTKLAALRNSVRRVMKKSEGTLEEDVKNVLASERNNGNYNEFYPDSDHLQLKDLAGFTISSKGVTFMYDYGYAHVSQAIEPAGEFFLSYSQLKPFIRRDGLLARFIH